MTVEDGNGGGLAGPGREETGMRADTATELLRKIWLFERCTRTELRLLAKSATALHVAAGTVLAQEGELGREFFVVRSGCVEVMRCGTRISSLGPGNFFGEMSLLERRPRTATVRAVEPSELFVLTAQQFTAVVDNMPSVDRKIMSVLAARVRELEERFLPQERILRFGERFTPEPAATSLRALMS
jgi:CRP-like cAMP-binding protein